MKSVQFRKIEPCTEPITESNQFDIFLKFGRFSMISLIISCIVLALLIVGGSAFVSGPKFHMNRMISRRQVLTPLKLTITDLHNGLFLEIGAIMLF